MRNSARALSYSAARAGGEKRMRTGCAGREIHRAMPLMMNRGGRKRSLAPLAYLCKIFSAESSATSSVIIVIIIVVQKYKLESSDGDIGCYSQHVVTCVYN